MVSTRRGGVHLAFRCSCDGRRIDGPHLAQIDVPLCAFPDDWPDTLFRKTDVGIVAGTGVPHYIEVKIAGRSSRAFGIKLCQPIEMLLRHPTCDARIVISGGLTEAPPNSGKNLIP